MQHHQLPPEFEKLTDDQIALIDSWFDDPACGTPEIRKRCLAEFQIDITIDRLRRYNAKIRPLRELAQREADGRDIIAIYNGEPSKLPKAAMHLLQDRAYTMLANPGTKKSLLMPLYRIITYHDRKDWLTHKKQIATERLALDQRKQTHKESIDAQKLALAEKRLELSKTTVGARSTLAPLLRSAQATTDTVIATLNSIVNRKSRIVNRLPQQAPIAPKSSPTSNPTKASAPSAAA